MGNLQCTDWFVAPPNVPGDKWLVARNYDTVSSSSDGETFFGCSWDLDSEHETKDQAEARCAAIKGTNVKNGYELIIA